MGVLVGWLVDWLVGVFFDGFLFVGLFCLVSYCCRVVNCFFIKKLYEVFEKGINSRCKELIGALGEPQSAQILYYLRVIGGRTKSFIRGSPRIIKCCKFGRLIYTHD